MLRIDKSRGRKGEVHIGQTFIGRHRPRENEQGQHAKNFERALENALEIADSPEVIRQRRRMGLKNEFHADVSFEARVIVRSPGDVGEYIVVLKET